MKNKLKIAIDGPASAGKSTIAKLIAKDLGYIYCDTGAMYRALTYAALENQIDVNNEKELTELLDHLSISFKVDESEQKVFINGKDITDAIRNPEVTNQVSAVSAHEKVRKELVSRQQKIAGESGVVMDGRDIGTAVLPNADVKIFMIASVKERAERRFRENLSKGINTPLALLQAEIEERDYKDTHRAASPLVQAPDAIQLDTTSLSIQEAAYSIKEIINKKREK